LIAKDPTCEERQRLWDAYNAALTAFSERVEDMSGSMHAPGFEDRVRKCQESNERCKAARAAWERHLAEHSCE